MPLTKATRDSMSADLFAVPGKRKLPMIDPENPSSTDHLRMAWSMVTRTQGLTEAERAEARRRILRKAKAMGVDTGEWTKLAAAEAGLDAIDVDLDDESEGFSGRLGTKLSASAPLRFEAANLDLKDEEHPNKMFYSGVLTRVDRPSDGAPHGSGGKRILLSKMAAESAKSSLLHMGVNLNSDLSGHDPRNKIGVITAADIEGDAIHISGHIYKGDFPKEAATIKAQKDQLGFSFEADSIYVRDAAADPLEITSMKFTGASILLKDKAAYRSTSLAASAAEKDIDMTKEEMAALLAETVKPLAEANQAITARLDKMEASGKERMEASVERVREAIEPHASALDGIATKMEMNSIGLHPEQGHVAIIRGLAGSLRADAAMGRMPYIHQRSIYASTAAPSAEDKRREEEAKAAADKVAGDKLNAAITAAVESATKPLLDKIAASETKIADLKAAAFNASAAPARKTAPSEKVQTLAKSYGITLDVDKPLSPAAFDKILNDAGIKDAQQRLSLKIAAGHAIANGN